MSTVVSTDYFGNQFDDNGKFVGIDYEHSQAFERAKAAADAHNDAVAAVRAAEDANDPVAFAAAAKRAGDTLNAQRDAAIVPEGAQIGPPLKRVIVPPDGKIGPASTLPGTTKPTAVVHIAN